MQENQPKKEKMAYEDTINGIDNIQDTPKRKKPEGTGNIPFDKKVNELNRLEGNAILLSSAMALLKFIMRYVVFVFLGMLIPFQFFDKRDFTFSGLFLIIAAGAIISYALYCVYVYFIRTPLFINRRLGIVNKFQEYTFVTIEAILPGICSGALFLYIMPGTDNGSLSFFSTAVAIAIAIVSYLKLRKEVGVNTEEYVPVLAKWVHKLSKKNNTHFNPAKENNH